MADFSLNQFLRLTVPMVEHLMKTRLTLQLATLALLICGNLTAGQLSPDLTQKIAALDSDQMVKVWIELPQSGQAQSYRSAAPSVATAVELHRNALTTLKDGHASAQADLVAHLEQMEIQNRAVSIKPHWLVNVIEAEISVSELAALALRSDIATISVQPTISLIRPVEESAVTEDQMQPDAIEANLTHIKAPQAWTAGYTGAGRVICSFDTGVDGAHPALNRSWRGRGGSRQDSLASWFDPVFHQTAPHTLSGSQSPIHGTHTMGIMVGLDTSLNNSYGVAPDAKWISAGVIDIAGASIIDAFEWAADPDGDPNTVNDMPDVINHSWGYEHRYLGCEDVVYSMVDATEALGIVNIFAAGNGGPADSSIYNPANRANDSLDCFAVGNLRFTMNPPLVDTGSSRGPALCGTGIKPNVMAPGYQIRSTLPNNTYGVLTGTSMAAPHVAGLVALLRQAKPSATVTEIKKAILTSTQKFTWSTPDIFHGWGEIDCMAAINTLLSVVPSTPQVRIYDFTHNAIAPGDIVTGRVVVQNIGTNVINLSGSITGSHPLLTITDGTASFGTVGPNAIDVASDDIVVTVSDTVSQGTVITVPFQLTGGSGYSVTTSLAFVIEPRNSKAIADHETERLSFSVSNYGPIGLAPGSIFPTRGKGFNLDSLGDDLYEGGLMITTGSTKIESAIRFQLTEPKMDFKVAPGGDMEVTDINGAIDRVSSCIFTDQNAASPIGLKIYQKAFSFAPPYDDIAILQYVIRNTTGSTINNLRFGLSLDWDIVAISNNAGGWESVDQYLWTALNTGPVGDPNLSRFRGARLVNGSVATAATADAATSVWLPWWAPGANGYTDLEKYLRLISGIDNPTIYKEASIDLIQTLAAGPITLTAGQVDTVAFAIIGGFSQAAIGDASARAPFAYALVAGSAPSVAALISPAANDTIGNLLPTFVWHASQDVNTGETISYTLRYGTDPDLIAAVEIDSLTDTTTTLADSLGNEIEYYWQIVAHDNVGLSSSSVIRQFTTDIATDVPAEGDNLPRSFALWQNYPNPFNPSTVISFELPRASDYELVVYDITGRKAYQRSGFARAGITELVWNATDEGSGVYLYRLTAGNQSASRKMLLLK